VTPRGEKGYAYRNLVGKHEVKRPRGRPRLRWNINIKRDVKQITEVSWTRFMWLKWGQMTGPFLVL